jgi:DNA (cytosine-5)-methyltransferase 1
MNGLDLFSGIGGIALALKPWVRTVAYCERERHAQAVLLSRMRTGDLDEAPIWDDVQTLRSDIFPRVDIISGGFPCQDISTAGSGAGMEGKRSGLVFELLRLVGECGPRFVFLENVPALAVRGLDRLLLELDALGYDARWTIVSAAEMGAPHLRERIWILAHANGRGLREQRSRSEGRQAEISPFPSVDGAEESLADAQSLGSFAGRLPCGSQKKQPLSFVGSEYRGWNSQWATEPEVGRVAHGVSHRVDCLRELGNGVVHQTAQEAFMRLAGIGGVA